MFTEEDIWIDHIVLSHEHSYDQLLPILQLICLVEQIYVSKEILVDIINFCRYDIRKILLQLHFWFDQGKQPLFSLRNNSSETNVGHNKTKGKNESLSGKIAENKENIRSDNLDSNQDSFIEIPDDQALEISIVSDPCTTRASLETGNKTNNRTVDVAITRSVEESERKDKNNDKTNSITTELQIEYSSLNKSYFGNYKEQFLDKSKVTF